MPAGRPVASTHITRAREAHPPFIGVSTLPAVVEELRAEDEAIAAEQAASADFAGLPVGAAAEQRVIGQAAVAGKKRPRSPPGLPSGLSLAPSSPSGSA